MTRQRRRWRLERWLAAWLLALTLLGSATGCEALLFWGACATCLEGSDDTPAGPTFTFSPVDGDSATGPFALQLALTDAGRGSGVATIDVEVDGQLATMWNAAENAGSVTISSAGPSRDVVLDLIARDADGNMLDAQSATIHWTAVETFQFVECNGADCTPLTFAQVVSGTVTIGLDASPDPVDSVSFRANAIDLGTDTTAPYRVDVDFTQFTGVVTLTATVAPSNQSTQIVVDVVNN